MRDIKDYIKWVYDRGNSGGDHNLEKIKRLLFYFDNPQDKIKIIHVAGTNGKGSTSNMIASILSENNKVGLFTSPFMIRINEAISINGEEISDEDFMGIIDKIKPVVELLDKEGYHNTYFEVLTAIMYIYFYEKNIDVGVVETGLGGTLDSTNIIKYPIASVITTISMDHTNILGNSLEEIAENKAGIIKKNAPIFLYPKEKEIYDIFKKKAKSLDDQIYTFSKDEIKDVRFFEDYNEFSFRDYKNLKTRLVGDHQLYNASLAIMVIDYFKDEFNLTRKMIYKGLYDAKNPGRLQKISDRPKVLLDGSHNKEAIDALINSLSHYKYDKLIIGFSILKDKEYDYVLNKLSTLSDTIILTEIKDNERAFKLDELLDISKKYFKNVIAIEDNIKAYEYSKEIAGEDDLIIWCGSLYLIGNLLKHEKEIK